MKKVVLGLDIGGTNTAYGFVGQNGNIVHSDEIPTCGNKPVDSFINRLGEKIDSFFTDQSDLKLRGIGVGAPNGNFFTGIIQNPTNLSWGDIDIVTLLQKKFHCDVSLTNDANAAALGEKKYGIASEMNDFVVITLGTGMGSGIFSGGFLLYGTSGLAGEMGHLSIAKNGRACSCGLKGCLEMYVSAKGIK